MLAHLKVQVNTFLRLKGSEKKRIHQRRVISHPRQTSVFSIEDLLLQHSAYQHSCYLTVETTGKVTLNWSFIRFTFIKCVILHQNYDLSKLCNIKPYFKMGKKKKRCIKINKKRSLLISRASAVVSPLHSIDPLKLLKCNALMTVIVAALIPQTSPCLWNKPLSAPLH